MQMDRGTQQRSCEEANNLEAKVSYYIRPRCEVGVQGFWLTGGSTNTFFLAELSE